MNRKRMLWAAAATVGVIAALAWAFAPRALEVEVARAETGRFERSIDEEARTRLLERYLVSAPLAGQLDRITLREGDAVEAADVVARLSPTLPAMLDARSVQSLQARVAQAEALLQRAGSRIELARVGLQRARGEQQRNEQLAAQGFISATRLESDLFALRSAQRELEAAQHDRHVAEHELDQAQAALLTVRDGARRGSPFDVRAPISGHVLKVLQTSAGAVALGTPLLELGDTARLEVVAELLTSDALQTPPGTPVRIDRWGGPVELRGQVRRVEPAAFTKVSALGVEEQRVRVLIDIDSPRAEWQALGDGYRVLARIVVTRQDAALLVPVSAVFPSPQREGEMAVFAVDDGRARLVPVELAARNATHAWLRSGLEAGATVVVYPPPRVADGVRVKARAVTLR